MKATSFVLLLLCPILAHAQSASPDWTKTLDDFIQTEMRQKGTPSVSIAVVDDQKIVWSKAFGFQDLKKAKPATPSTVYRVGSVSKLFTDICVMQLVEEKKLDLDADVTKYLPEFQPVNTFGKPITLRHLMSHRSGLIRESPVGNYFDPSEPTLEQTVRSLNGIPLVYEPGKRIKYSNAAVAAVGYILEKIEGKPFAQIAKERVLDKIGMAESSFLPTDLVKRNRAEGQMHTYHDRSFVAPTFELGMAPAGCMYSNANELSKFVQVLFKQGEGILKPGSFKEMLTPQFAEADSKTGFGLGFMLGELDGHKRIGHGGAIYGFSTELAFLPEQKLGVVVIASRDVMNAWTTRVADDVLKILLAVRAKQPMPMPVATVSAGKSLAREWVGRYRFQDRSFDLSACEEKLMLFPNRGGFWTELRRNGDDYQPDDGFNQGPLFKKQGDGLLLGKDLFVREKPSPSSPSAPPVEMLGLIGEYGWDHNTLYIFEKDGQLWCNIEWFFLYPLKKEKDDSYLFPDFGLYHGEKLVFERDAKGKATICTAAHVAFKRRKLDGEDGQTFKVQLTRLVKELEPLAKAAKPPLEKKEFRKPDLVELAKMDASFHFDLRYATNNNFLGTAVYPKTAKAYMQKPAAEALVKVNAKLKEYGLGIVVFDSYRPWYVTKIFRDAVPPKFHNFVANPALGSRHNRGCAVDLGLYDLKSGNYVEAVGGYDEFSDRAYPNYIGGTSRQRWHRDLLRRTMESEGYTVINDEWWHFDYKDWNQYGIGNQSFEELGKEQP